MPSSMNLRCREHSNAWIAHTRTIAHYTHAWNEDWGAFVDCSGVDYSFAQKGWSNDPKIQVSEYVPIHA